MMTGKRDAAATLGQYGAYGDPDSNKEGEQDRAGGGRAETCFPQAGFGIGLSPGAGRARVRGHRPPDPGRAVARTAAAGRSPAGGTRTRRSVRRVAKYPSGSASIA